MGRKAALRTLKRKMSDALYTHPTTDALAKRKDPGGQTGNDSAEWRMLRARMFMRHEVAN
jgi:hypothetical protein